ncbi:MAG: glycosyltransferase family 4 protein [Ignavibacteriae bacterium]|nr:glycosyltransferase family 4 protein [Ignavibacteriota bacterium]
MKKKVLWLCPYPVDTIPYKFTKQQFKRKYHPASWIRYLADELGRYEDIELHILTITPWIKRSRHFIFNNINFHILKSIYTIPFINLGYPSYFPIDRLSKYFLNTLYIKRHIRKIKPDLIHIFGTETRYGLAVKDIAIPNIISLQGPIGLYKDYVDYKINKVELKIENETINDVNNYGGVSDWSIDYIKKINPEANIYYFPEAINKIFFENNDTVEREVDILYLGNIEERKGIELLIDIVKYIVTDYPKLAVKIIGSGDNTYVDKLNIKIANLNLRENISFLGRMDHENIKLHFDKAKMMVFPTQIDNTPNSVVEALASGLPVIASDVGGLSSLIKDGVSGYLFDRAKPDILKEKIILLLSDKYKLMELSTNARRIAKEIHYPTNVAIRAIEIYNELINNGVESL